MNLLALDTSSLACSVALQIGEQVSDRHEEQPREHTRLLVPMIRELLDESGTTVSMLDAIVLGNGPGSFIGMRIATSVAQGIAFAIGAPIVPVSSLLAIAAEVSTTTGETHVAVCQDAHMDEIYLGLFGVGQDRIPVATADERLQSQAPIAELEATPGKYVAAGFGWQRYPALKERNATFLAGESDILHPSARYLLAAGAAIMAIGGAVDPQDVAPAYLRQTVASRPGANRP